MRLWLIVDLPEDEFERSLGDVVREFRVLRGLSQGNLADRVGVDRKTINRIENGRHRMAVETLMAIADSLEQDPADILARLKSSKPT